MSIYQWRWSVVGIWIAVACIVFLAVGGTADRNWLLLLVASVIPPMMLLWLWNDDGPLATARLQRRRP